jgi:hypothetical protein
LEKKYFNQSEAYVEYLAVFNFVNRHNFVAKNNMGAI